jgi:hypothetical protein
MFFNLAAVILINNLHKQIIERTLNRDDYNFSGVIRQFVVDVSNYQDDFTVDTYYYSAISDISSLVTYMGMKYKFKNSKDPLFTFNSALETLHGRMLQEDTRKEFNVYAENIRRYFYDISEAQIDNNIEEFTKQVYGLNGFLRSEMNGKLDPEEAKMKIIQDPTPEFDIIPEGANLDK